MPREHPQFQEFYAANYPRLRRLGYWLTGDWTEAEELAQEAMVRTWWRWSIVRGHDRPHDYARKVLVNRHRSLRYHLDLSQAEVAARLGLSRQQVRTLEAKLRGSVRRALRRADGVRTLRRHQRDDLAAL